MRAHSSYGVVCDSVNKSGTNGRRQLEQTFLSPISGPLWNGKFIAATLLFFKSGIFTTLISFRAFWNVTFGNHSPGMACPILERHFKNVSIHYLLSFPKRKKVTKIYRRFPTTQLLKFPMPKWLSNSLMKQLNHCKKLQSPIGSNPPRWPHFHRRDPHVASS